MLDTYVIFTVHVAFTCVTCHCVRAVGGALPNRTYQTGNHKKGQNTAGALGSHTHTQKSGQKRKNSRLRHVRVVTSTSIDPYKRTRNGAAVSTARRGPSSLPATQALHNPLARPPAEIPSSPAPSCMMGRRGRDADRAVHGP